jgi:hypothetical protein
VPFTASQLGEVPTPANGPTPADGSRAHVYDVELPYRRLGRCRMSEPVAVELGTRLDQVAAALSTYEARHGRSQTASQLLGAGVDLGAQDGQALPAAVGG